MSSATVRRPLTCHLTDRAVGRSLHRVVNLSYRAAWYRSPSGLDVGPVSSFLGRQASCVVSPDEVYSITDEPTALHLHAVFALSERQVYRLEALFSTLVYEFWTHVEQHWRRLCDEIERGTLIVGQ